MMRSYIIASVYDLRPWLVRAIGCGIVAAAITFGTVSGFTIAAKTFGVKREVRK
jgi:hypothetical protein